jgi:hypothetical protein
VILILIGAFPVRVSGSDRPPAGSAPSAVAAAAPESDSRNPLRVQLSMSLSAPQRLAIQTMRERYLRIQLEGLGELTDGARRVIDSQVRFAKHQVGYGRISIAQDFVHQHLALLDLAVADWALTSGSLQWKSGSLRIPYPQPNQLQAGLA